MKSIIDRLIGAQNKTQFDFSSVLVVYQIEPQLWRGFVMPFDITYEAESKDEVVDILRQMTEVYVDGLKEYNNPTHLSDVPLSNGLDTNKWISISQDLTNKLLNKISRVDTTDYYAEAQLPA